MNIDGEQLIYPGFLIAEPELQDPNFLLSVIALIHHDENGSFGLILNRQTNMKLEQLLPEYAGSAAADLPVFLGGPVEPNRLFTLHSGELDFPLSAHSVELAPSLHFEPDFAFVEKILRGKEQIPGLIRFYVGYAGWSAGQLERELAENSWFTLESSSSIAFSDSGQQMWIDALTRKGPYFQVIAQTGFRPSIN